MVRRATMLAFASVIVASTSLIGCGGREVAKFSTGPRLTKEQAAARKAGASGNYAKLAKEAYLKSHTH